MTLAAVIDPETEESPVGRIAAKAVAGALMEARSKEAVLCAVIRIAGEGLAQLSGHDAASREHARRSRLHFIEANKLLRQPRRGFR